MQALSPSRTAEPTLGSPPLRMKAGAPLIGFWLVSSLKLEELFDNFDLVV